MEFKRVLGRRRSFHYFATWRPVEREKIQAMLEAARRASRAVNTPFFKAVVTYRDRLSQEERNQFKTAWEPTVFDFAPVSIFWYHDTEARVAYVDRLKRPGVPSGALQDNAVMAPLLGWSRRFLSEVILPELLAPGGRSAPPARGGNSDAAMAREQALLCAYDEGLAATLVPFDEDGARTVLGVPEVWEPLLAMLVGYPAESWEAGGQAPGLPFEDVFFAGSMDTAFERDPQVVARLQSEELIQEQAPIAWRKHEIRGLDRMFRLPASR